ncbi:unnamed protein product [Caenorhabditis auriculariae]|uniref:Pepsin inhibitor-3-like repeated domain-containing protein n=1 Tax=Caenorhabditis auriculariae TaxID=2777116 RepID=A0A8S1HJ28_9PELO|nr:unnamed protein product [Caenorhabditis auriculariae]
MVVDGGRPKRQLAPIFLADLFPGYNNRVPAVVLPDVIPQLFPSRNFSIQRRSPVQFRLHTCRLTSKFPAPGHASFLVEADKMKFAILLAVAVALAAAAPRDKRQVSIGTIAISGGAGGSTGCVVTGNVLFVNGFRVRELNGDEQSELESYQTNVDQYKNQLRDYIEQQRQQQQNEFNSRHQGRRTSQSGDSNAVNGPSSSANTGLTRPTAPAKPSFCSADATTQYYFDGCMVQDNKVYVGREYARDLTADEQEQLKKFDEQQTAYQNAVQQNVQSQMKGLFGTDFFSALFGGDDRRAQQQQQQQQQQQVAQSTPSTVSTTLPPKPDVPNFCTAIF